MTPTVHTPDEAVRRQIEAVKVWLRRHFRDAEDPSAIQTRAFEGFHTVGVHAGTHHTFLRLQYEWLNDRTPAEVTQYLEEHRVVDALSAQTSYAVVVGYRGVEVSPR